MLSALIAVPEGDHVHVTGIVWGVSLGLALAHWFAFRVSARWAGEGSVRPGDVQSGAAQLAGGAGRARAAGYAGVVLVLAVGIAVLKNYLAGH